MTAARKWERGDACAEMVKVATRLDGATVYRLNHGTVRKVEGKMVLCTFVDKSGKRRVHPSVLVHVRNGDGALMPEAERPPLLALIHDKLHLVFRMPPESGGKAAMEKYLAAEAATLAERLAPYLAAEKAERAAAKASAIAVEALNAIPPKPAPPKPTATKPKTVPPPPPPSPLRVVGTLATPNIVDSVFAKLGATSTADLIRKKSELVREIQNDREVLAGKTRLVEQIDRVLGGTRLRAFRRSAMALQEEDARVVSFLREHPESTSGDIAEKLGPGSHHAIVIALRRLSRTGRIQRNETGYVVIEENGQ